MESDSEIDTPFAQTPAGKIAIRLGSLAGLIIVALVLSGLVIGWRGNRAWAAYVDDASRRHIMLTLAPLIPKEIPESENFAAIPVFQDAFKTNDPSWRSPFRFPDVDDAPLPELKRGKLTDLTAMRNYFIRARFIAKQGDSAARDVLQALEHYEPFFAQLRSAASRPSCKFPVKWEDGIATHLPHIPVCLDATRMLRVHMAANLAAGDSAAAYEDFKLGMRIHRALGNEPALISSLIRLAMLGLLQDGIWEGISRGTWAANDLEKIERDLRSLDFASDYLHAIQGERAGANGLIDDIVTGRFPMAQFIDPITALSAGGTKPAPSLRSRAISAVIPNGWLRQNEVFMNHVLDDLSALADPATGTFKTGASMEERIKSLGRKRYFYLIASLFLPSLDRVEWNFIRTAARTEKCRAACALARWRAAKGAYPDRLDQLVPDFLPALPRDPNGGGPLHYRPGETGGATLWSADPNAPKSADDLPPRGEKTEEWIWRMP